MRNNAYQNYFENEVLAANPLKLVELLYRGAMEAIASARRHLRSGDIRARSRAINKAMAIVTELSLSLNHEQGGELSRNLASLYAYIERLLIQANSQQCEPPLAEAETLLSTLLEGWTSCTARYPDPAASAHEPTAPKDAHEPISCAY